MCCKPKFPREDRFLHPIAHSTKQFRSFRTFQQLQPASQRHPTPYPSGQQHVPASQRHIPLCILPASSIIHQEPRIRKLPVGYPQSMNRRPERLNWDAHWELAQKASWNVETVTRGTVEQRGWLKARLPNHRIILSMLQIWNLPFTMRVWRDYGHDFNMIVNRISWWLNSQNESWF